MDAEASVAAKQAELREAGMVADITLESKRKDFVSLNAENTRTLADAEAYRVGALMKIFEGVDTRVIQALAAAGMQPGQLIAQAFSGIAEKAEKIGQLNVSPDLLNTLLEKPAVEAPVPADNDRKIILVTRKTRLEELIAKYLTAAQARFYVEHLGADFSDYQREHDVYQAERRVTVQALERWGRYQIIDRSFLPNFIFGPSDIVVALGQDGVVANTMKYLHGHPLIGLNPDAKRYDGILLPFVSRDLPALLREVAANKRGHKAVTMAKAALTNGQVLYAVNDLFIGARTHTSAVYEIALAEQKERQSSSGLIVATGLGSTAWFKSIVTGSLAIAGAFGGGSESPPICHKRGTPARCASRCASRFRAAPRRSAWSAAASTRGGHLSVRSLMPENGVIFSDGIEADRLDFNSGTEAQITVAEREGRLVV